MKIINLTPHPLVIQRAERHITDDGAPEFRTMSARERDIAGDLYPEFDRLTKYAPEWAEQGPPCTWRLFADEPLWFSNDSYAALKAAITRYVEWCQPEPETLLSSGIARCATTETVIGEVNGLPVVRTEFGAVEGLPPQSFWCEGCQVASDAEAYSGQCSQCGYVLTDIAAVYVVSSITAQGVARECAERNTIRRDVFVPARPVRDAKGNIIACTALGRVS